MKKYFLYTLITLFVAVVGTASAQDYTNLLRSKLLSSKSSDGMTQQDVEELTIYNQSTNRRSGVEHVHAVQKHNGIEVFGANVAAAFRGQEIIHIGDNLQTAIASRIRNTSPVLTPMQAATKAATLLGAGTASFSVLETISSQKVLLDKGDVSLDNVPVKLVYQLTDDNGFRLAWDLSIHMLNEPHWYSVRIDAENGEILGKQDFITTCTFGPSHSHDTILTNKNRRISNFGFNREETSTALAGEQYNVFALPLKNPNDGPNQIVVDPQDSDASPFGWHDVNGVVGADFTITRGNNAYVQDDLDANTQTTGQSPNGGADLNFDFEYNFNTAPVNMIDATMTNLFYLNNVVHDIMYHYGFDEQSGNFQEINYSGTGIGGDSVNVDAQDGANLNNASFGSAADGFNGKMNMFLWDAPLPTEETFMFVGGGVDGSYLGVPASFGIPIPNEGETPITGMFALLEDNNSNSDGDDTLDACDPIINGSDLTGNIAVIRRGSCEFGFKINAAENAGAIAVIMVNNVSGPAFVMNPGESGTQVTIPSFMVSRSVGDPLIAALQAGESVQGLLTKEETFLLDSGLDNEVVIHEYGHGITKRLTGGAADATCLGNEESMDEGWSDYYALMLTMTEDDLAEDAKGFGAYVNGESIDGAGIRIRPYSTSFFVNDLTYGDTNNEAFISRPHGIGTVWGTMIWDMTWLLIDEYGFDADLYNGTSGNNIALQIVTDALKMQPCRLGFVNARDAVLAALEINTMIPEADKQNITCRIWGVFANRGLGVSASQGDRDDRTDQTEAFNMPSLTNPSSPCFGFLSTDEFAENNFSVYPNPSNGQISLSMTINLGEGQIQIMDLNGRVVLAQDNLLEGTININASKLAAGVYLLQVSNQTISETIKLIIK